MKNDAVFKVHNLTLAFIFILGNASIIFPVKNADRYTVLGYIITCVLSLCLFLLLIPAFNLLFCEKEGDNLPRKIIKLSVFALSFAVALYYSAEAFLSFAELAAKLMLPKTPKLITCFFFLISVVFFATRREEDLLKFSLLAGGLIGVLIIFFFIASISAFDLNRIFIFSAKSLEPALRQTPPYIKECLPPCLLLGVYQTCVFGRVQKSASFWGIIIGFILLWLCILNSVLIFGVPLSARLSYPYASAVSTVSVGRLFTRLDGFAYFIYYISSLTKITVCIFICCALLKKGKNMITDSR